MRVLPEYKAYTDGPVTEYWYVITVTLITDESYLAVS